MDQHINRRSVVAWMAAVAAAAVPGRARSAPDAPEAGHEPSLALLSPAEAARYHLAAYKAAVQAIDPTIKGWSRVVPEDDNGVAFWLMALRNDR
ncbi:MAG: hypothetical protein EOQ28_04165 [Mesorhizobium sp.]|uniref:hypothetical protein n=1 Tax=Mesorhizobium sp. TaxID=1871066 RepID=UPI000FE7FEFB|nr:hypothetical protein [Mesorhizobium sp.]RWA76885.1 MAG: hypothetical protein EOQ28_04165 [Mesorhizobium sp.]